MEAFKVFDPSASGFVSFDCFRGIMTRYDKVVGSYFLNKYKYSNRCDNKMSPSHIMEMLTEVGISPADGNVSYEGIKSLLSLLNMDILQNFVRH